MPAVTRKGNYPRMRVTHARSRQRSVKRSRGTALRINLGNVPRSLESIAQRRDLKNAQATVLGKKRANASVIGRGLTPKRERSAPTISKGNALKISGNAPIIGKESALRTEKSFPLIRKPNVLNKEGRAPTISKENTPETREWATSQENAPKKS